MASNNIFEHIFYEIEMYRYTYGYLILKQPNSTFEHNMACDSHAIHLRNLATFFHPRCEGTGIHVFDLVSNVETMRLPSRKLCRRIQRYTSGTTGHITEDRYIKPDYKDEAAKCYAEAFPKMRDAIHDFTLQLDTSIKPEYETHWEEWKRMMPNRSATPTPNPGS